MSTQSTTTGTAPARSRVWAIVAVILGLLGLLGGVSITIMFGYEIPRRVPLRFGRLSDQLGIATGLLTAVIAVPLSLRAARSLLSRLLVALVVLASIAAAISAYLLVTDRLDFVPSTTISVIGIVVQGVWMIWLNRRYLTDPTFPRATAIFGLAIPIALFTGMLLVGLSLLLPANSWPAVVVLGIGVVIGGTMWAVWPFWFVLVGWFLWRGPRAASGPSTRMEG